MRGSTPRPYATNVAPAPHLSFSCVKKKDGGERKSLWKPSGGGRPTLCLAATPVSLRASTLYKKNRNFVAPASPPVRPLITMRQPVLLATSPASRLRNHTHRKVGRPTPQGQRCMGRRRRQGWMLYSCRSRRLRPPSPYGDP